MIPRSTTTCSSTSLPPPTTRPTTSQLRAIRRLNVVLRNMGIHVTTKRLFVQRYCQQGPTHTPTSLLQYRARVRLAPFLLGFATCSSSGIVYGGWACLCPQCGGRGHRVVLTPVADPSTPSSASNASFPSVQTDEDHYFGLAYPNEQAEVLAASVQQQSDQTLPHLDPTFMAQLDEAFEMCLPLPPNRDQDDLFVVQVLDMYVATFGEESVVQWLFTDLDMMNCQNYILQKVAEEVAIKPEQVVDYNRLETDEHG